MGAGIDAANGPSRYEGAVSNQSAIAEVNIRTVGPVGAAWSGTPW